MNVFLKLLVIFLTLTFAKANAITLNCQFNEKINPAIANKITCGMDSNVWGGEKFEVCNFKNSLSGSYVSRLILNDNKGQTYRKWSQAYINYSIKQNGILPKPPIDDEISVLFHHHHKIGEGKYLVSQHHLVLKSNIDNIYTLFVDSRTGQSFLEYKVSFGTGEPKSKLSTWRETTLGICEITPEKN